MGYRIQDGPEMAQLSPQMARVAPTKTQEASEVKPWDDFARNRSGLGARDRKYWFLVVRKPKKLIFSGLDTENIDF